MSNAIQLNQLAQKIQQYQQHMESLNNNINILRQNIERPDISNEEKEALRKQEQELQTKLVMLQSLISNLNPQNLQQRVLQMGSPASTADNMSVSSIPGSPASFNPQQPQQHPNFAAVQAATQAFLAQQQLRQQPNQQPQQMMNKMNLAASSPQTTPQVKPNQPPSAGIKNNGMFSFPANQPTTPGGGPLLAPNIPGPKPPATAPSMDSDGVNRVLTKRKIQELVTQIDPSERLEPEVEDILLEIADEFIESVTSFACQLAKHRKSDTLEVKDVQLHLERNWNIRIPGFAADDIRSVKKPTVPASHQSKIQAVNQAKNQTTGRKID